MKSSEIIRALLLAFFVFLMVFTLARWLSAVR